MNRKWLALPLAGVMVVATVSPGNTQLKGLFGGSITIHQVCKSAGKAAGSVAGAVGNVSAGAGEAVGGVTDAIGAVAGGCASEMTQWLNNLELIAQVYNSTRQLAAELKMIATLDFSNLGDVARGLRRVSSMARSSNRVVYNVDRAAELYTDLFPLLPPTVEPLPIIADKYARAMTGHDAGLVSKKVSSAAVDRIDELVGGSERIIGASKSTVGQKGAIQAQTEAIVLQTETLANQMAMQAAHYRVVENRYDAEAEAALRARVYRVHLWRGIGE